MSIREKVFVEFMVYLTLCGVFFGSIFTMITTHQLNPLVVASGLLALLGANCIAIDLLRKVRDYGD